MTPVAKLHAFDRTWTLLKIARFAGIGALWAPARLARSGLSSEAGVAVWAARAAQPPILAGAGPRRSHKRTDRHTGGIQLPSARLGAR